MATVTAYSVGAGTSDAPAMHPITHHFADPNLERTLRQQGWLLLHIHGYLFGILSLHAVLPLLVRTQLVSAIYALSSSSS